jgi:choline monooxygenase
VIDEDIRVARTLPARFYRDPVIFEQLRERVLARGWQFIVGAEQGADRTREAGSVLPFELLPGCVDEPLLLCRDEQGALHGMSNVCTHRGNLVCTEAGKAQSLRCRYHGRRFGLDGRFLSMPDFEGVAGFPSSKDDLPRIQLGALSGLLFAGIDPMMPFDALIRHIPRELMARLVPDPAGSRSYEVKANWALYCDNYLEGFHLPFVHPGLSKLVDYASYQTELFDWSILQTAQAVSPSDAFAGSTVAAYYFFLFPNTMLNFYPWGLSLNVVVPLAVDRTRIVYRTFVSDPSRTGGAGGALDKIELEDEAIVEQVQRGLQARLYDRGRYSPSREAGVHHFHRLLTGALA